MARNPKNLPSRVVRSALGGEIAGISRDPFVSTFGGLIRPRDDTLLTRGGAQGIWVYDDIERDAHAYAELQKRKMAVVARPWQVDAGKGAGAEAAAALVRAQLEDFDFDRACMELLDAILKGFSVAEVMWAQDGRAVYVDEIRPRDQRRFVFDEDCDLHLLVRGNLIQGEPVPERKFIVHRFGAKDGNPYGLGLGTRLFWPVLFKRQGIKFWLTFCDKFGSPTAMGSYPKGSTDKEQQALLDALGAIARESGIIFPEGTKVELLEAARSGNVNTYEALCRYMDEQISAAVLSEANSARAQGGALAAAAITRKDVRLELVQADSDLLSQTLNDTLVKWIVDFNMPGAPYPSVWRDVTEPEDLKARAERDAKVHAMGFKPTLEYIRETYGDGWEVDTAPRPKPSAFGALPADPAAVPPQFADPPDYADQAALDAAIAQLPPAEMDRQALALLKPAMDLIAAAASYEEILERLAAVYPKMDTKRLEDLLARALYVSDAWGRISAASEKDA